MGDCTVCGSHLPAGSRWCPICRSSTTDPTIGKLATPGRRLGAYFLEFAVLFIPLFLVALFDAAFGRGERGGGAGPLVAGLVLLGYVIWALILFTRGQTPGKQLLKLRVVRANGQRAGFGSMLLREFIGKLISTVIFMLGFIWILIDKDHQGWHDKLASTFVVQEI
ncbi:MAG TPA: RDD family protein [Actinomycetota bacterium]|nr:RDD family protein [Actinomycetota bacterium]